MLKEKIKVALKQKYTDTGLGDDVMDGVAEILSHNVKEEAEIDTAVAGCEGLLRTVQGSLDKERNARSSAEKRAKALADEAKQPPKEPAPKPGETSTTGATEPPSEPSEMRTLIAALSKQVAELTEANTQKSKLEQLTTTLKENKVPEAYYRPIISGRTFPEDFDVATYATEVQAGWQAMEKELAGKRFDGVNPPDKGDPDTQKSDDPLAKLIRQGTDEITNKQ